MASININLPEPTDRRLREEAARRNASPEDLATRLLARDLSNGELVLGDVDSSTGIASTNARSFKDWLLGGPSMDGVDVTRDQTAMREIGRDSSL